MIAPISVCLIVKNEQHTLEKCLKSIRPFVKEIVVVDTGSTDNSVNIAKQHSDIFESYFGCNHPDGRIKSFADARNYSFSLATQPWVMWIDGDDEVFGAENLVSLIDDYEKARNGQPSMVALPYEYGHDELGNVTLIHERERIVSPKRAFRWVGRVHEVLVPISGDVRQRTDRVKIVHRRDSSFKQIESGRNLRILKEQYDEEGDKDARHLYYLGLEYGYIPDYDNAIKFLSKYVEKSGWDEEKCLACMKIAEHYMNMGRYDEAIPWALKASVVCENWGEPYFMLAKCSYFLAQRGVDEWRNWDRCITFARRGLSFPPTKTQLFINPLDRSFDIHIYLNFALSKLHRTAEALESVETALKVRPNDGGLLLNRDVYKKHLVKEKLFSTLSEASFLDVISTDVRSHIDNVIGSNSISFSTPVIKEPEVATFDTSILARDIDSPPPNVSNNDMLGMIRTLWKNLLLHDEVLNAKSLLKSAPWRIRDHEDIRKMAEITDKMLVHLHADDTYYEVYNPAVKEAIPLPEEIRHVHGQYSRFKYLSDVVDKLSDTKGENLTLLDIGCIDGWVTNRLGLRGYKTFGVDYANVDTANAKAVEYRTGAKHAQLKFGKEPLPGDFPEKFDVVSLFEVYEHVEDAVSLIRNAISVLKPGGTFVLSTPRGSWCQGVPVPFHVTWNSTKPREHVRAPILSEVIRDMEAAGLVSVVGEEILVDQSEQPIPIYTQASLCVQGKMPDTNGARDFIQSQFTNNVVSLNSKLDVIIYVGSGAESWNPETAKVNGIGGSETAVIEMSKNLVKLGHSVRVYGDCIDKNSNRSIEGTFEGVVYLDSSKFHDLNCDILITSRRPEAVDDSNRINRKATFCWVHDVHLGSSLTHARSLKMDKILTLSEWHRSNVLGTYRYIHPSQVVKTRNGIDLTRFNKNVLRNPTRAIYSSSPDRGMEVAVRIWPRVRERIPGAELHVFYGFKVWESYADQAQKTLISNLKKLLKDYESAGVVFHGRVDQNTLADEFLKSGCWVYPTWFSETSCQLAGSLIFTRFGMKPIENIQIDDLVLTHKGRFRKVTKLIRKEYDGPLYTMKRAKDSRTISLTSEHPLYVANFHANASSKGNRVYSRKNDRLSWKVPGDLIPKRDYLTTPRMKPGSRPFVKISDYVDMPVLNGMICQNHNNPSCRPIIDTQPLTENFMYLLGLFAAEGCVSQSPKRHGKRRWYSSITFAFHKKETHLIKIVTDFFGRGNVRPNSENGVSVTVYSSPWANFLKNIIGTGKDKKIPDFVWDSNLESQKAFLRGMLDGDGSKSVRPGRTGNGYEYSHYTTISPSLAYGCAQILTNAGSYPSIQYDELRMAFNLFWSENPGSKQYRVIDDQTFCTRLKNISIEHYSGTVYNFEVDEDESYVTDRTVVHNCISAMEAQAAGLRIITSPIAALNETVGSRGKMIHGDWLSLDYQNQFIDEVVKAMSNPDDSDRLSLQEYATKNFGWNTLAVEWEKMFFDVIEEVKVNIVPPYKGWV